VFIDAVLSPHGLNSIKHAEIIPEDIQMLSNDLN